MLKGNRSSKVLYDGIIKQYVSAKERYHMLLRRKELLVSSDTDKEFLEERVNRAKEKYEYYRGRLSDYIKYIPDDRTRDCTYKAYIDGLNTQEICCLYYVDESVINRELKAGRQILTALDSWVKDHK